MRSLMISVLLLWPDVDSFLIVVIYWYFISPKMLHEVKEKRFYFAILVEFIYHGINLLFISPGKTTAIRIFI